MNVSPDRPRHTVRAPRVPDEGGRLLAPFAGLFHRLLDRIDRGLAHGSIDVRLPDGTERLLGGRAHGPDAVIDLLSWRALIRLATSGSEGWYVAWSRGEWTSTDPVTLFELFVRNRATLGDTGRSGGVMRLLRRVRHWAHSNTRIGSRRNIAFHYDLGNDFYREWLDPTLSYSCALFDEPVDVDQSLESAQTAKLAAILARTGVGPGESLLEIGCGWGGLVELAVGRGIDVHAITLSEEQRRAVEARLAASAPGKVTVALTDYRDVEGCFDGVASVEMVEAVGERYWPAYLEAIARALRPGGRAAIQYIAIDDAIFDRYARNVDFVQARVFPGGMLLSERRFRALADRAGFDWCDQRSFGAHYAETLRRWLLAFDAACAERRLPARFDRDFITLWRYYLMYCEGGFRGGGIDVAQVTLVKRT